MLLVGFGATFGVPAYAELVLHLFDGLGAGPTANGATFKSALSPFAVSEVVHVLRKLGLDPRDLAFGVPQHPRLFEMLKTERWYFFREGFQTFWKKLAKRAKMSVENKVSVTSMLREGDKWKVTATKGRRETEKTFAFDHVIVTTAPQDAHPFLPKGEQKDLIAQGIPRVPPNDVFLVEAEDTDSCDNDIDNRRVAFWPTGLGQGSDAFVDPATWVNGVKTFFVLKRHAKNNIYAIGTYVLDPAISVNDAFDALKTYAATELGLKVTRMLKHERFVFPSGPKAIDTDAWQQAWAPLQGRDGLWFNGEAICGSGIPRITQFTTGFVAAGFPDL